MCPILRREFYHFFQALFFYRAIVALKRIITMKDENVGLDAQNSTGTSENENPGMGGKF